MHRNFSGVFTALVTPFNQDGSVDFISLSKIINHQIVSGISGFVVCGTTGEAPTLDHLEQIKIIELCSEIAKGKVPVIAGVGGNNTKKVVEMAIEAEAKGVDAVLVIAPYYNRPSPEGLIEHFRKINDVIKTPIIVYNHPGRTGVDIGIKVLKELSAFRNIVGVKDVSGDLSRILDIKNQISSSFVQFSGDDILNLAVYAYGGDGAISVVSNAFPEEMVKIYKLCFENNIKEASSENLRFLNIYQTMGYVNPVSVKYFMKLLGMCDDIVRLPLVGLDESRKKLYKDTLIRLRSS
jgi:4-hydroxy-tetrahydrodipicolinate synthase